MNAVLEQIYRDRKATDLDGNVVDVSISGVPTFDGEALHALVRAIKPAQSVETGFAYGLSTLFILDAMHENGSGHHTAIDPFEVSAFKGVGIANVQRAGFAERFTHIQDYSQDVLPRLLREGLRIDFAFIDGHHTFDQAFIDFYYCDKMMNDGGIVVFHDFSMPAVRKAVTFILRNLRYTLHMDNFVRALKPHQHAYHRARMMARYPTEPASWAYSDIWAQCNFCVLRKLADDGRPWDHYVSF